MIERMYSDEWIITPDFAVTKAVDSCGIHWSVIVGSGEPLSKGDRVEGTYKYGNYTEECDYDCRDYSDPFDVRFTLERGESDLLRFSGVLKKVTPDVLFIDCSEEGRSQILVVHLNELKSLRRI